MLGLSRGMSRRTWLAAQLPTVLSYFSNERLAIWAGKLGSEVTWKAGRGRGEERVHVWEREKERVSEMLREYVKSGRKGRNERKCF
jgi:hypothetical protein